MVLFPTIPSTILVFHSHKQLRSHFPESPATDVKTANQGASYKVNSLDQLLKAKLSLNLSGPWEISAVGPSATIPDKNLGRARVCIS